MANLPVIAFACGNTMRGDDGVAWRLGAAIEANPLMAEVEVVFTRQLMPEHAQMIEGAEVVLFLDCSAIHEPGEISTIRLNPAPGLPRILTHHLDPASLLRLAVDLYGCAPAVACAITIGGGSFALSEQLTEPVEAAIARAAEAVTQVIAGAREASHGAVRMPRVR